MGVAFEAGHETTVEVEPEHSVTTTSKGARRGSSAIELRRSSLARRGDRRDESYAVLDQIEDGASEDDVAAMVDRARAGDDLAFAELYIRFFDRVNRYLLIALKNPDDALDAAQQVFVKVLEALPGHEPLREPFRAWLFRVVRNHAIDQQRRSRSATAAQDSLIDRTSSLLEAGGGDDVTSLIASLPQTQQRVLVLRFVYEFTTAEVGEALGSSPDAVRHTQMRALRALARLAGR
jgi:RNA polymerase sigma-70 factor (ECF subfamily)